MIAWALVVTSFGLRIRGFVWSMPVRTVSSVRMFAATCLLLTAIGNITAGFDAATRCRVNATDVQPPRDIAEQQ